MTWIRYSNYRAQSWNHADNEITNFIATFLSCIVVTQKNASCFCGSYPCQEELLQSETHCEVMEYSGSFLKWTCEVVFGGSA